jgi:thiol-disulfide isomerase/thioredoxin
MSANETNAEPSPDDASTDRPTGRRQRGSWVVAAVAILVVGGLIGWQVLRPDSPDGGSARGTAFATGLRLFAADERPPAPSLDGETLDGEPFELSDLAGNVVVINIWGSWCGPCRVETPDLVRVANEHADQPVKFVGIDTRDSLAGARAFVARFKVPYPSIYDQDGQALLSFNKLIPSAAVPSTVVIGRDNTVAATVVGAVSYSTLSGLVEDELKATS